MARKYRQPGVIVSNVERNSGLRDVLTRGDFIYQIDNIKIHSLEFLKIVIDELIPHAKRDATSTLNETV